MLMIFKPDSTNQCSTSEKTLIIRAPRSAQNISPFIPYPFDLLISDFQNQDFVQHNNIPASFVSMLAQARRPPLLEYAAFNYIRTKP